MQQDEIRNHCGPHESRQRRLSRKETFDMQKVVFATSDIADVSQALIHNKSEPSTQIYEISSTLNKASSKDSKERRLSRKDSYVLRDALWQVHRSHAKISCSELTYEQSVITCDNGKYKRSEASRTLTSEDTQTKGKRSLLSVIISRSSETLTPTPETSSPSSSRSSSPTNRGFSSFLNGKAASNFLRSISATAPDRSPSPINRAASDSPSDRSDYGDTPTPRSIPKLFSKFRKSRGIRDVDGALHYAASRNDGALVSRILDEHKDADVNVMAHPGVTALHQACVFGNEDIVRELILHGANVNLKTWSKLSPLQLAASFGHFDVAALLIEKGADCTDVQDGIISMAIA